MFARGWCLQQCHNIRCQQMTSTCLLLYLNMCFLGEATIEEPTRIWGEKCTKSDIVINQGPTAPLPTGIPTYTVEVVNACVTGCEIYGIHFKCGWFSSAHLINPRVFKRLRYDDCLVNDGKPLVYGGTLSFQYANTYPYPLSVSSVLCMWNDTPTRPIRRRSYEALEAAAGTLVDYWLTMAAPTCLFLSLLFCFFFFWVLLLLYMCVACLIGCFSW